jgi:hypothetical protein
MATKYLLAFKTTGNLDRKVLGVVMISKEIKIAPM